MAAEEHRVVVRCIIQRPKTGGLRIALKLAKHGVPLGLRHLYGVMHDIAGKQRVLTVRREADRQMVKTVAFGPVEGETLERLLVSGVDQ
jgi:hypothetical protein